MAQPPATTSSGIDKRTGALLSYILEWVTGIIFLFVGKGDPDVQYHAAQSVVWFGGLFVLNLVLSIVFGILGNVTYVFALLGSFVGLVFWVINIASWIYCLYKAWTGGGARFEIPLVGGFVTPYAERLAAAVR